MAHKKGISLHDVLTQSNKIRSHLEIPMVTVKPDIGQWYLDRRGAAFEVVAIDNDDRTIEIQSYDGTVYEIDEDSWANHAAEEIEPPEDYSGSLDMATEDAFTSQFVPKQYWSDPLDFIDEDYFDPQD